MRIAQRGTAAVTTSGAFPVDRWSVTNTANGAFSAQQNASAPAGFNNSLLVTVTTAQTAGTGNLSPIQNIEGFNLADLGWGTANAQTVTLSFWVRSSLTGTFGATLRNGGSTRTYPYTYTISTANIWEYKTVTIEGDTSGTWLTTNGNGVEVRFSLFATTGTQQTAGDWFNGSATGATGQTQLASTNGATWQITGVQLEKAAAATSFEHRPIGTELALCQRYFYNTVSSTGRYDYHAVGGASSSTNVRFFLQLPVEMRTTPSVSTTGTIQADGTTYNALGSSLAILYGTNRMVRLNATSTGLASGQTYFLTTDQATGGSISYSAEL
jgi:hypothetical protein